MDNHPSHLSYFQQTHWNTQDSIHDQKTGLRCTGSKKRSAILQPERRQLSLYLFSGDFDVGMGWLAAMVRTKPITGT